MVLLYTHLFNLPVQCASLMFWKWLRYDSLYYYFGYSKNRFSREFTQLKPFIRFWNISLWVKLLVQVWHHILTQITKQLWGEMYKWWLITDRLHARLDDLFGEGRDGVVDIRHRATSGLQPPRRFSEECLNLVRDTLDLLHLTRAYPAAVQDPAVCRRYLQAI